MRRPGCTARSFWASAAVISTSLAPSSWMESRSFIFTSAPPALLTAAAPVVAIARRNSLVLDAAARSVRFPGSKITRCGLGVSTTWMMERTAFVTRLVWLARLRRLLRLLPLFCCAHRHLALENLALRHQLAVYKKTVARPKVCRSDRLFWVALSRVWAGWRQALVIVSPNTVLRWQRRRFREYWTKLAGRPAVGRPPVTLSLAKTLPGGHWLTCWF